MKRASDSQRAKPCVSLPGNKVAAPDCSPIVVFLVSERYKRRDSICVISYSLKNKATKQDFL